MRMNGVDEFVGTVEEFFRNPRDYPRTLCVLLVLLVILLGGVLLAVFLRWRARRRQLRDADYEAGEPLIDFGESTYSIPCSFMDCSCNSKCSEPGFDSAFDEEWT